MKQLILIIILALLPVRGEAACYSPSQAEAEQAIRIHSELMVIGLNCQHMGKREGMNLYGAYRGITERHKTLFQNYDTELLRFFQSRGDANPDHSLKGLRTRIANKISNDAAKMRPDIFCAKYAQRMERAAQMNEADIRAWAKMHFPSHPVSLPLCKSNYSHSK